MKFKHIFIPLFLILLVFTGSYLVYSKFRPYRIGVIFSQGSSIGKEEFLAARYFADEFGKAGTHPVRTVYFSPEAGEDAFREACRKLRQENVSVIIGAGLSWEGVILADELKDSGIPVWGIASTTVLSNKRDNFFRIVPDTDVISSGFTSQFMSNGYKRVRVIRSVINEEYSHSILNYMQAAFPGEISDEYYSDEIAFVSGDGVDVVFCICNASDLASIIKQIGAASYSEPAVYAADWGYDELTAKFRIPGMEGVRSLGVKGNIQEPYGERLHEFSETMNIPVTYGSQSVYVLLEIANEALTKAGDEPEVLIDEFSKPAYHNSVYGGMIKSHHELVN